MVGLCRSGSRSRGRLAPGGPAEDDQRRGDDADRHRPTRGQSGQGFHRGSGPGDADARAVGQRLQPADDDALARLRGPAGPRRSRRRPGPAPPRAGSTRWPLSTKTTLRPPRSATASRGTTGTSSRRSAIIVTSTNIPGRSSAVGVVHRDLGAQRAGQRVEASAPAGSRGRRSRDPPRRGGAPAPACPRAPAPRRARPGPRRRSGVRVGATCATDEALGDQLPVGHGQSAARRGPGAGSRRRSA